MPTGNDIDSDIDIVYDCDFEVEVNRAKTTLPVVGPFLCLRHDVYSTSSLFVKGANASLRRSGDFGIGLTTLVGLLQT